MAEAVVGCEEDEGGQLPRRRSCGSMIRVELTMMVVYTMRKNKIKWGNLAHEAIVIPNRLSLPYIPPEMLLNFRFQLGVTPPQSDGVFVPPFSGQQSLITQNAAPIQYDQDVTLVS